LNGEAESNTAVNSTYTAKPVINVK